MLQNLGKKNLNIKSQVLSHNMFERNNYYI